MHLVMLVAEDGELGEMRHTEDLVTAREIPQFMSHHHANAPADALVLDGFPHAGAQPQDLAPDSRGFVQVGHHHRDVVHSEHSVCHRERMVRAP